MRALIEALLSEATPYTLDPARKQDSRSGAPGFVLRGPTFKVKDELRSLGAQYDSDRKVWTLYLGGNGANSTLWALAKKGVQIEPIYVGDN